MNTNPRRVLYVTYDGLNEQLGQSQVLPYLRGLVKLGHRFEVISFEKPGSPLCYRKEHSEGITWTALRYHKTPTLPATAFDMTQGLAAAGLESILNRTDLIHVRSYVPCALVLPCVEALRIPLLFDMRGLWADERAEAGRWDAEGKQYKGTKAIERVLLRRADAISVLTLRLQNYLRGDYPHAAEIGASIHTIPTCVDLDHFRPDVAPHAETRAELGDAKVLLYLGAIGSYYLPREMANFYLAWRKYASPSRLLVVSRQDATEIRDVLAEAGVAHELVYRSATRAEVPSFVRCGHASFGLYRGRQLASYGTAATKTGETLACGLPFASSVVGDVAVQLGNSPAGVSVSDERPETLDRAARELAAKAFAPGVAAHARRLAESWYDLAPAVTAYDAIYRGMPRRHLAQTSLLDTSWPPSKGNDAVAR
ncbi:MAG TPA: glycosyltransferase [Polyangiaceae bacterium]|nr:glycosyltransferase [Polyangiaceae bacterium]